MFTHNFFSDGLIDTTTALMSSSRSNSTFKGRVDKLGWLCTYCGRKRHKVDTCWKKNGVPDNLNKKWNSLPSHASVNDVNVGDTYSDHTDSHVYVPTTSFLQLTTELIRLVNFSNTYNMGRAMMLKFK